MKPLNYTKESCNPISSNCVIWQGPDIECLSLCKGDTVTDVVYKLALQVCAIFDTLQLPNNYDLSAFNLNNCGPETFQELIQFILDRIINLESCTGCTPDCNGDSEMVLPGSTSSNPEMVIPVELRFVNDLGDTVTTLPLQDFVKLIANTLVSVMTRMTNAETALSDHETRITVLENTPVPTYTPPSITPNCDYAGPQVPTNPYVLLAALDAAYCQLVGATGAPNIIYTGIAQEPASLNTAPLLNTPSYTYASIADWVPNPSNSGESIGNIWIMLMDMYQAIRNIQLNCCPTGCAAIELTMTASITGNVLTLYFIGVLPSGFVECNPLGAQFTIKDDLNNVIKVNIPVAAYLNVPGGYAIDLTGTPISILSSIDITSTTCFYNAGTNTQCERYISYRYENSALCLSMTTSQTQTTLTYNFTSSLGLKTYTIELWNHDNTIPISSHSYLYDVVNFVSGTFTGLIPGTSYKLRMVITPDGAVNSVNCPFLSVATLPLACIPPTGVTAVLT